MRSRVLEEKQEYDVNVRAAGNLEVRRSDIILRDGIEIARTYHRYVVTPGDDTTNQIEMVKNLAQAVWTQDMIDAAKAANAITQITDTKV